MIEINLVPDVKREFIRAQRQRALVVTVAIIASIAALGLVVLLAIWLYLVQMGQHAYYDSEIDKKYKELSSVEDLSKIVTIQNQLSQISTINSEKKMQSRLFDVLSAISPAEPNQVAFSQINVTGVASESDSGESTEPSIVLQGETSGYDSLETFKKTVENTIIQYTPRGESEAQTTNLVSSIVLSEVGYGQSASGQNVLYFTATLSYAEELFAPDSTNITYKLRIDGNVTDSYMGIPRFSATPNNNEGEAE